jgi:hypothetical protein
MAKFEKKGKELRLIFDANDKVAKTLSESKEYELVEAKPDHFMLIGKDVPLEDRILKLVEETPLSQRVEGRFEKLLNKDSLKVFQKLLKEGLIVRFKLSKEYKKAIYKTINEIKSKPKPDAKPAPATYSSAPAPGIASALDKDGFMVVKNQNEARELSDKLGARIKSGEIKGTRGFDGGFYILKTAFYEKVKNKLLPLLQKKSQATFDELTVELKVSKDVLRAVTELLKEEGEVSEKRKELIKFIE